MVPFHAASAKTPRERVNTRSSPRPPLILHLEVKIEPVSFVIVSSYAAYSANFFHVWTDRTISDDSREQDSTSFEGRDSVDHSHKLPRAPQKTSGTRFVYLFPQSVVGIEPSGLLK